MWRASKILVVTAGSLVVVGGAAVGAAALYENSRTDQIADGVRIAGVSVGGMSADHARAALSARLRARLERPIVVRAAGRRFVLLRDKVVRAPAVQGLVNRALAVSQQGNFLSRAFRDVRGADVNERIPLRLRYSRPAVQRFVSRIARAVERSPVDATLRYMTTELQPVPGKNGLALSRAVLVRRVSAQLRAPHPVPIAAPTHLVPPKVTMANLASHYPVVITVDRNAKQLHLFKNLQLAKTYTIAVGMIGLETPAGLYHVQDKQVDPSWHVPNSAWAGSLAGQVIPPGPQDPLKARWLGIFNGAGIHGTDVLSSLGTAASHGCIRMSIPDVIELYDQTPVGAPVYIQ
jgi:lipoprotein-anchoring transpeptidase ErfK/SrfK